MNDTVKRPSAQVGLDGAGGSLSAAERAYLAIHDMLVSLEIRPGAPINEDRLTRQLGIGRTPVLEALKRLETERLVVIYPRRGSFATDIHITHLALISDLRLQLEPLPACRAAERATQADRALCQRVLLDGLPALAGQDFRVLAQWDTGLHRLVYRCAGNSYLEATLTQYHSLASRIWYLFADRLSGMAEHVVEDAEVLTAIVDRDPDRAAAVGHQNVRNFERAILAVIEPARDVRWP